MSFSYDVTALNTTPLYQVRFRLGDTDANTASFQDEEITYVLGCNNNHVIRTCIDCISALLPRIAAQPGFKLGPYEEKSPTKDYDYWNRLLAELKSKLTVYGAPLIEAPTGPCIFYYDMHSVQEDGYAEDP